MEYCWPRVGVYGERGGLGCGEGGGTVGERGVEECRRQVRRHQLVTVGVVTTRYAVLQRKKETYLV